MKIFEAAAPGTGPSLALHGGAGGRVDELTHQDFGRTQALLGKLRAQTLKLRTFMPLTPAALASRSEAEVDQAVRALHEAIGDRPGHIFNLGHGIQPDTPVSGAQAFVRAVKELAHVAART